MKDTFAYLNDINICSRNQAEHGENPKWFMQAASKYNLTSNKEKSSLSFHTIKLLGHSISKGVKKPDPQLF